MSLPANSGTDGWDMEILSTVLLYPRQEKVTPFVAKSLLTKFDVVYTVMYQVGNINLYNDLDVLVLQLPTPNVLNVDLAFDQLDREFITWELAGDQVWMYWYDPILTHHTSVQIATGNNPCCMIDERRGTLISNSDVFLFYQRGDLVFYRLQRERYLIEHSVPHNQSKVVLETCGMGTNLRLTLRTKTVDAHLLQVGDKFLAVDSDNISLPYGEIP